MPNAGNGVSTFRLCSAEMLIPPSPCRWRSPARVGDLERDLPRQLLEWLTASGSA